MPAASMPTMEGVNSTSGHLKRSEPMVITCTRTAPPHAPAPCQQTPACLHHLHPSPPLQSCIVGQCHLHPYACEPTSPQLYVQQSQLVKVC